MKKYISDLDDDQLINTVAAILLFHTNELESYETEYDKQVLSEHVSFIVSCFLAQYIEDGVESLFPKGYMPYGNSIAECKATVIEMLRDLEQ